MPSQFIGTAVPAVIYMNQALNGMAPSNAFYNADLAYVNASGVSSYAIAKANAKSNVSDAVLATSVLANLGVTVATIGAVKFAEINDALGQVFAAYPTARGQVILNLANLLSGLEGDVTYGAAAVNFNNAAASNYNYSFDAGSKVSMAVNPTPQAAVGQAASLTTGLDNLTGSALADIFSANVVQNSLGSQTNQLATGDRINGGDGVDTLNAVVQMASALNNSPSSAITPITTSVEKAMFTALTVNNSDLLSAGEVVNINAKSMTGLTNVGSVQSDASLFIQNLTTLTDTGVYADRRNTETITIRMDHSGNDKAADKESNLTVLFDNDYLVSGRTSTSSIGFWVEDREAAKLTPATPLKKIDATGVNFTINGVVKSIVITPAALATFLATDGTFAGYAAALQAALTIAKATDPSLANVNFTLDNANLRLLGKDGTTLPVPAPAITLTSSVGETLVAGGFVTKSEFGVTYDVFTEIANSTSTQTILPITSNIELNKVGRGAEGGSLVVGGMSTDLANKWDYSATALKEGVEQFNVTVSGDTTQMSSLSSMASTNNTLQTVNVSWATGSLADLIIGNHNTAGAIADVNGANNTIDGVANVSSVQNLALKDVRTFTATNNNSDAANPLSVQTNDVTLNAYLSNEVVAKYMNRADNIANAATDNANFVYTTGAGNDSININISKDNLAASGTATREDFKLSIDAGAGNNTVVAQIGNGTATSQTDAWYVNQTMQKNLSITTGAGNDTVRVNGAGSWTIATGAGNDAVYSDNSGRQVIATNAGNAESTAVWVFNSANQSQNTGAQPLFNLTSAAPVTAATKVANLELTVSYRGINVTVPVGDTASTAGGSVDDLTINQAIKAAINGNVYLSKLLSAQDGTGRTLVVTSLTDGVFSDADLSVTVANPTALSVAQTAAGAAFLTPAQLTALGLTGGTAVVGGRFDSAIAEDASAITTETSTVTWQAFVGAGTQTIGGMTVTATGAFTDLQVAQIAGGGAAIAGLTVTTAPTLWTVGTAAGNQTVFTSVNPGNVTDIVAGAFTGAGNAAPAQLTVQGTSNSIVGANSAQPNTNNIDAGLGNDVVVLSTAGVTLAKETVNVASVGGTAATDSDVVFNAGPGASITIDAFDTVISTTGFVISGGVGTVSVLTTGITGSAGADTINGTNSAAGLTISGLAGNDTITASLLGSTVIGGEGSDTITFAANAAADTLVFNSLVGSDTISGYAVANDTINVSKATFAAISNAGPGALNLADFLVNATGLAAVGTDRFIYNNVTGALNYDADGTGPGAPVLVATFTGVPALVLAEFVVVA